MHILSLDFPEFILIFKCKICDCIEFENNRFIMIKNYKYCIRLFFHVCILDCNYELFRDQVELGEIIGEGQFGDVHKGICHMRSTKNTPVNAVAVAIKTCKTDADMATTDKFLEEACKTINKNK